MLPNSNQLAIARGSVALRRAQVHVLTHPRTEPRPKEADGSL